MTRLLRHPERLARWLVAMATYHAQPSYVERGRRLYPLLFADALWGAMRRAGVRHVLDVGAHCGEFGRSLRLAGYDGPIVSFEPNPDAARVLKARAARDGQWVVQEYALGDADGEVRLHRPNTTQFASLRTTLPFGADRWGHQVAIRDTVTVPVHRLDDVFDSVLPTPCGATAPAPILLKIDTQGSDLDVLNGAVGILDFVSVLVIELSVIPLYEGAPRWIDALRYVEEAGFTLAAVAPVTHDKPTGIPVELDGCFVRRPMAVSPRVPERTVVSMPEMLAPLRPA